MALIPSLRILKVFSQPWEGDVTMVLPSTYMQIKKSITNPTAEDLRTACRQARQSWRCRGLFAKPFALSSLPPCLFTCLLHVSTRLGDDRALGVHYIDKHV